MNSATMHPQAGTHSEPSIAAYLADIIAECGGAGRPLVSLILFGSAATGGYVSATSDVDLLLVLNDHTDAASCGQVRDRVTALAQRRGVAKRRSARIGIVTHALATFADRVTANVRTFFVCTRADLPSGTPGRIPGLAPRESFFRAIQPGPLERRHLSAVARCNKVRDGCVETFGA